MRERSHQCREVAKAETASVMIFILISFPDFTYISHRFITHFTMILYVHTTPPQVATTEEPPREEEGVHDAGRPQAEKWFRLREA